MSHTSVDALVRAALHQGHGGQQDQHEDEGDGGGKVQVIGHVLPLDRVADKEELAVAEFLRDIKGADRRDEHHRDAGHDARQAQREDDPPQHAETVAAEVARGLDQARVHLGHDRVDWQDHIREVVVHHADDDGALGADDVRLAEVQRGKEHVEQARVLQDGHPRIGADEEVHPHRDHDERDDRLLRARGGAGDDIRDGVAHEQADGRGDDGQLHRAPEDEQVRVHLARSAAVVGDRAHGGEKLRQVFGREPEALVRERIVGHEHERHGHEDDRPHGIRCERQTMRQRGAAVFGMDAIVHSSGSLSASESSSSSLLNEE